MNKFKDCVAVVTGSGSGIGKQLALQLADAGAHLAISDIMSDNLEKTHSELEARGIKSTKILTTQLDVADEKAMFDYASAVKSHFGKVNIIFNNAGVALGSGPIWKTPLEDFKWVMSINFDGVLSGTYAFLPHLREAEWGHVVNISSIFGIISVPTQSAYNASKFAVRGLSEALRQELKLGNSSVSATCIHPGGIKTNIARFARRSDNAGISKEKHEALIAAFDELARTSAESAAQQILRAVIKDKARLLIGWDAKLVDKIQRLLPTQYGRVMRKLIGGPTEDLDQFK